MKQHIKNYNKQIMSMLYFSSGEKHGEDWLFFFLAETVTPARFKMAKKSEYRLRDKCGR